MERQPAKTETDSAYRLLGIVRGLFRELRGKAGLEDRVSLDSRLDRDLGFDSLARVELLSRIQRAFAVDLPEEILNRAETTRDLLEALRRAASGPAQREMATSLAMLESAQGEAAGAATLLEVLDWHVRRQPERIQIIAHTESGDQPISGRSLAQASEEIAAGLQNRGIEPGQSVAIMLPTCPEYFYVYLGILLAGGIPVPIYPPARLTQVEEHVR
ncbi:MAG: AMP-binding protein, partial [Syntrophus sp. (in: bacteria)]|nr:AMP-binding protein [Syntrophus sp. (in: bacteria)]